MANGSAALQIFDPPSAPAPQALPCSRFDEIGQATALAACTLCAAMLGYQQTGTLAPVAKEIGGERIAKVAQLELDTLGEINNFAEIAHREGLRHLRKYLDSEPGFRQRHGATAGDATLSFLIDGILEISKRAVAVERALMAN